LAKKPFFLNLGWSSKFLDFKKQPSWPPRIKESGKIFSASAAKFCRAKKKQKNLTILLAINYQQPPQFAALGKERRGFFYLKSGKNLLLFLFCFCLNENF
jgi:hypothetical protein